jgi:type IV pilus assembly protein PilE
VKKSGSRVNARFAGFTLMEIMVVMTVVAILSAIAYPVYQDAIRKTKRAEGRAALMQLMQQEERYYSQTNTYIQFSSDSSIPNEKKFKWFSGESATTSAYEIKATACAEETIQHCVLLTAMPGTGKVNMYYKDTACGELTLTSTGIKKASDNTISCW